MRLEDPSFVALLMSSKLLPHSYIPPDRNVLSGRLLDEEFKKMQVIVKGYMESATMARCTVASDGMTYMKKPFENYFVLCDGKVSK